VDFTLTPDQALFRETTRSFLETEVPLTRVRELAIGPVGFDPSWWERGAELGWTTMLVAPEFGGDTISGNGVADLAIVAEEMGRLVSPGPFTPVNVVARALSHSSNAGDFADVIEELMAGTATASWAVYEPGRGWDPAGVTATARLDGGDYVLSGVKDRVDSGDQASYFLVTAQAPDGLAQFLVPSGAPGVSVIRDQSLDLVRRYATARFADVRVPAARRAGTTAEAEAAVAAQLATAAALTCAEITGAAGRVLEFTVQWAFDRYSFGRPLASYQALKHRFADMKLWLEASYATAGAVARAAGANTPDAAELASVAKAYIGEHATDLVHDCVQLHGGIGVTWEHDLHLYLRRVTVDRSLWGTPSEHRRLLADLIGV
jgi:alkylation response protein AidB-like acyl-CoA dehydrogenase